MRRIRRTLRIALLAALLGWAGQGRSQVGSTYGSGGIQVSPRIAVGGISGERSFASIAQGESGDLLGGAGTTQTDFIREAFTINRELHNSVGGGLARTSKIGRILPNMHIRSPIGRELGVPFFGWLGKPTGDETELKAGRFYLDLISASGTVNYSDNSNQSEFDRRGRARMSTDLFGLAIFQMSETTRLSTGGEVHWFPLESRVTLSDVETGFGAGYESRMNAAIELDHSAHLGPTANLFIRSDLRLDNPNLGARESFDLLEGPVGSNPNDGTVRNFQPRRRPRTQLDTGVVIVNDSEIGVTAVVPSQTRLTLSYRRENQWFALGAPGRPNSVDTWRFDAANERENMRFKPFVGFQADHRNNRPGFIKQISAGATGPVTEYVDFLGKAGIFLDPFFGTKGFLFDFRVRHRPRQGTTQFVGYSRRLTFPDFLVASVFDYRLEQILSPEWTFDFAYERRVFEPVNNTNNVEGSKEDQIDVRFVAIMGRRVNLEFGYSFIHQTQRGFVAPRPRQDSHEYLLDVRYQHTPDLESIVSYRFRRRLSNIIGDSFDENLVQYRMQKSF